MGSKTKTRGFCRALLPVAAATFLASAAYAAEPVSAPEKNGLMVFKNVRVVNAAQPAPAAASATQGGFRAYIDPATGQLRQPTSEDIVNENAQTQKAPMAGRAVAPRQFTPASGGIGAVLDESTMQYSVVHKNKDGSISQTCVTGAKQADELVSPKAISPAAGQKMESGHAH